MAKAFRPFTISPVLLVHVSPVEFSRSISLLNGVLLPSPAILKLYDLRCLSNERKQLDKGRPWSLDKEREYQEHLADIASGAEAPLDFGDPAATQELRTEGEFEAYLQHTAQEVFNAERTTYERLRPLQGTKIPKLYGGVGYEIAIPDACPDGSAASETIPGHLLEYVPSLTLRELVTTWTARDPPLPNGVLAALYDQVMDLVNRVSDFDVLNEDVRMDNFLVREPFLRVILASTHNGEDPADDVVEDAVVLIDFGHCRLRGEDESEDEWAEAKCSQDEEGAAGSVLLKLVGEHVGEDVWTCKWRDRWDRASEEL